MSFASSLLQTIKDFISSQQNRKVVYIFGGGLALLLAYFNLSKKSRPQRRITWKESEEEIFDVAIIGAGPSGATMGWYLAQESINGKKVKVVCFDKQKFPRDKICGDAVTTLAQKHLKRMGIIKELIEEDQCHWAQTGGFVSPSGYSFIGNSAKELNRGDEGAVVAIKRIVMDDKIVKAAVKAGVHLRELTKVVDASFDTDTGLWKIKCVDENEKELPIYRARMLVAADGSTSTFARKKGLVKSEPDGTCSRAFVTGEYNFQWDGVVFYPRALLPGYAAIMRHARNELVYCVYIIPGNPNCKNEHLTDFHHKLLEDDPFISKAIGPKANPRVSFERMKAASLRLGGLKGNERSYDDHFLVIGDAAGFIDPLTGEGIQYAMESGEIGAKIVREGLRNRNLSATFLKQYQDVWYRDWGREFYWSLKVAYLLYKMPIMLDAAAKLIEKRGAKFLADWAEVMTGSQSKMWFLRPDVWSLIVLEAIGIGFRKLFMPHTLPKPN